MRSPRIFSATSLLFFYLAISLLPRLCFSTTFLKLGMGARPAGMGEAFTAVGKDVHALYWNPAGLGGFDVAVSAVSHAEWFQGMRLSSALLSAPLGSHEAVAFGIGGFYVTGIERRTGPTEIPDGRFDVYDVIGSIGYARKIDDVWFGVTMKGLYERLDADQAVSGALDLGAFLPFQQSPWSLGFVLQHLGFPAAMGGSAPAMPIIIKAGASYRLEEWWNASADLGYQITDRRFIANLGIEGLVEDVLFLRAGYAVGLPELGALAGLRVGTGFRVGGTQVDYAFAPYGDLGAVHRISLVNPLGRSEEEDRKLAVKITNQLVKAERRIGERYKTQALEAATAGNLEGEKAEWEKAKESWEKILALIPQDVDAPQERETAMLGLQKAENRLSDRLVRKEIQTLLQQKKWQDVMDRLRDLKEETEVDHAARDQAVKGMEEEVSRQRLLKIQEGLVEGRRLMEQGDPINAQVEFRRVLELDSGHAEGKSGLKEAEEKSREPEKRAQLEAELKTLIREADGLPEFKAYQRVKSRLGDLAQRAGAGPQFQKVRERAALAIRDLDQQHTAKVGLLLEEARQASTSADRDVVELAKAIKAWAQVRRFEDHQPDLDAWWGRLGNPLERAKQLDREALKLYLQDRWPEAKEVWEAVLVLDPQNKDASFNLEKVERKLKGK